MATRDRDLLERELRADAAVRRSWTRWAQWAATWTLAILGLLALGRGAVEVLPLLQGLLP